MKFKFDPRIFLTAKVQFVAMFVMLACMFFMLYRAAMGFYTIDKLPAANDYDIKKFYQKYNVNPPIIKTQITLLNFLKFDSEHNNFVFDAMMAFDYNPQEVPSQVVDHFEFTRAKFLDKYIRDEVKISRTHTRVEYYVKVNFSVDFFDYKRFPVDDHIISMNLINPSTNAKHTMYAIDPKDFIVSANLAVPGWEIVCHQGVSGFRLHEDKDDVAEPILTFSLCLIKRDFRHIVLIIFPLFILFFGGFFALSIANINTAMDLARASVLGLLAYDYIIITISPQVAYFMLSDFIFLLFLVSSFTIYGVLFWCSKISHYKSVELIKAWASIIILFVLLVSWYLLIYYKNMQ